MGEKTDGHPAGGQRFTDRGARFTRRRLLGKAGIATLAAGTGMLLTGCQFDHGPYQGYGTGQSSTSGPAPATGHGSHGSATTGQGNSGSQSGASS
jgi:hypothetical protein